MARIALRSYSSVLDGVLLREGRDTRHAGLSLVGSCMFLAPI